MGLAHFIRLVLDSGCNEQSLLQGFYIWVS